MVRRNLLIALLLILSSAIFAEEYEIVIESGAGGQNREWFATVEGNWMESASKSKAPGLTATKALFKQAGTPGVARFTPDIPVDGEYEVFATYPDSGNAVGVIYHVHSASGDADVVIDQRGRDDRAKPRANTWFSLGKFKFNKGKDGYVEVRDPQTGKAANEKEPNVRIYADAVKFVPLGFALPPQFAAKKASSSTAGSSLANLPATPAPSTAPQLSLPQPTVESSVPSLAQAAASGPANLPSQALPSLGQASTAQAATPSLPQLSSTMPSLSSLPAEQTPSLPGVSGSSTQVAAPPSLPALSSTPASQAASSVAPSLPALGSAENVPSAPAAMPALPAAGSGPASQPGAVVAAGQAPALPVLGAPPAPPSSEATPTQAGSAIPALQPLSPNAPPPPQLPPVGDMQAGLPPTPPAQLTPSSPAPGSTGVQAPPSSDGLSWIYDEGTAHSVARSQNKKVLVFFVADGNRDVQKYESEYFKHPAVREALANFVLHKVNFPLNTKAAYKVKVYGAGAIAVTDGYGERIGGVPHIPPTPEDLAKELRELAAK